jgi:hypothetical protein
LPEPIRAGEMARAVAAPSDRIEQAPGDAGRKPY